MNIAAQSNEDLGTLNQQIAELYQAGKFDEAIPIAERALALAQKLHGSEHPGLATGLNNLAALLLQTNRLAEAAPLIPARFRVTPRESRHRVHLSGGRQGVGCAAPPRAGKRPGPSTQVRLARR